MKIFSQYPGSSALGLILATLCFATTILADPEDKSKVVDGSYLPRGSNVVGGGFVIRGLHAPPLSSLDLGFSRQGHYIFSSLSDNGLHLKGGQVTYGSFDIVCEGEPSPQPSSGKGGNQDEAVSRRKKVEKAEAIRKAQFEAEIKAIMMNGMNAGLSFTQPSTKSVGRPSSGKRIAPTRSQRLFPDRNSKVSPLQPVRDPKALK